MKRPYLSQAQRENIKLGIGDFSLLDLACTKFAREIRRSNGWIKKLQKQIHNFIG